MSIRVETLGGLRVLVDGQEKPALTRQNLRCGLLVHMAIERRVPRERLLSVLWPDSSSERGRRTLSQMLYELRRDLPYNCVTLQGAHVEAAPDLTSDASEFYAAVRANAVEEAISLYRGPFLDSVHLADTPDFENWVERRRLDLSRLFGEAQRARLHRLVVVGDFTGALGVARRWVLADPVDEEAQVALLRSLAQLGLRNEAVRQFEDYRRQLHEVDAEPSESAVRLVEDVRAGRATPETPQSGVTAWAPQARANTGVLVLPLEDMSADGSHGHFCDGLAEEIITALSAFAGLRVVPRTSAFAYRGARIHDAAEALGVTHAVEGSVRFIGDSYRITVRLIEAAGETELWQGHQNGQWVPDDVFAVQDRIAGAVAKALGHRIGPGSRGGPASTPMLPTGRRPTSNMEAYHLNLRARQAWFSRTREGFEEARQLFQASVAADPQYAQAHAGLADVYCLLGSFDYAARPPADAYERARQAAQDALDLDKGLSTAHAAMGTVLANHDWRFDLAEESYRRAIELDPGNSTARQWYSSLLLLLPTPREDEALAQALLALELDPRSAHLSSNLARHYHLCRRWELAAKQYAHAIDIDETFVTAQVGLALAELRLDRVDTALSRMRRFADKLRDQLTLPLALFGYALGTAGRADEAREVLAALRRSRVEYRPPEHEALVHLGLGGSEEAIGCLERACEAGSQAMTLLAVEPILDPIRDHPRFRALVSRVAAGRATSLRARP